MKRRGVWCPNLNRNDMRNKYENTDFREDLSNHYSTAENINAILCEQGP